jgi:hypothetical protein
MKLNRTNPDENGLSPDIVSIPFACLFKPPHSRLTSVTVRQTSRDVWDTGTSLFPCSGACPEKNEPDPSSYSGVPGVAIRDPGWRSRFFCVALLLTGSGGTFRDEELNSECNYAGRNAVLDRGWRSPISRTRLPEFIPASAPKSRD